MINLASKPINMNKETLPTIGINEEFILRIIVPSSQTEITGKVCMTIFGNSFISNDPYSENSKASLLKIRVDNLRDGLTMYDKMNQTIACIIELKKDFERGIYTISEYNEKLSGYLPSPITITLN